MSFPSPVVFKPYDSREEIATVLRAAAGVFEDFHHTREIGVPEAEHRALATRAGARVEDFQSGFSS